MRRPTRRRGCCGKARRRMASRPGHASENRDPSWFIGRTTRVRDRQRQRTEVGGCPRVVHGLRAAQPGEGDASTHPRNRGSGGQRVGRPARRRSQRLCFDCGPAGAAELRCSRRRTGPSASPRESQSALRPRLDRRRPRRPQQPPSPCRRGRPRFAGSPRRRLTGLSAALRHSALLAAGVLPVRRGARHPCRAHSAAPVQPALCQRAASASMRLLMRAAPAAQLASVLRQQPARHPWLAARLRAGSPVARGRAARLRPAPVPRARQYRGRRQDVPQSSLTGSPS